MNDYKEAQEEIRRKNEQNYQRMEKNSINGAPVRRTHKKTKKKYAILHRKLRRFLASAIIGAGITIGLSNLNDDRIDNAIVSGSIRDFQINVIKPETHRTANNEHYFFDYSDIYRTMCEMDDFDEAVYLTTACIGKYQTDKVLAYSDYKNVDNYLAAKGYDNEKEFVKDVKRKIVLRDEISEREAELNAMMQKQENDNLETKSYGGEIR